MLPSIPTPEQVYRQDDRDPDEIDRALVERFKIAIEQQCAASQIYVSLDSIARGPVPRTGLDPIRARAKSIAEASGWHVEVDGRSGGLLLTSRK